MFQRRGSRIRDMLLLSGWLFADLLLALMMIFLISINGGQPPPPPCATPSPQTSAAVAGSQGTTFLPGGSFVSSGPRSNRPGTGNGATRPLATSTPCPMKSPTPTPTPINCGLDPNSQTDIAPFTVANADGLRNDDPGAQQQFADQVKKIFHDNNLDTKLAGLTEIFGGSATSPDAGVSFAKHAKTALEAQTFTFFSTHTIFQAFWDGTIGSDQIEMTVFFYQQAVNGSCKN
jgi:hypothetical protein